MAVLNWIGKEAVVNHDKEVPFKLLEKVASASVGKESKNLIVHGDNLEALKALMPFYKGRVKCIYIDPPYNTGNESWTYNDNVNSPKIREWFKKTVGREGEDLTRHDKWLCMMYPRLKLLRDLLDDDGSIFVQIDGNESGNLRLLMDEIFGQDNYRNQITWLRSSSGKTVSRNLSEDTDYIFWYSKSSQYNFKHVYKPLSEGTKAMYNKNDNDGRGFYRLYPLQKTSGPGPETTYDFVDNSGKIWKCPKKGWRMRKEKLKALENDGRLYFDATALSEKAYWDERENDGQIANNLWNDIYNLQGANSEKIDFVGQKPIKLIKRVIEMSTAGKDALVLDSFAGSGTTAHAVMDLNKEDGGTRQFILVEMEDETALKITQKRLKRCIEENKYKDGFEFSRLAKPLFDASGMINEECTYDELAAYIYFTETQMNIDKKKVSQPLIGSSADKNFYLIYTGRGKNDLTRTALAKMKIQGKAVVYADRCLIDEQELAASGIIFKQIPYEIILY
jgi:adenine-specific DNA-methyltransferase